MTVSALTAINASPRSNISRSTRLIASPRPAVRPASVTRTAHTTAQLLADRSLLLVTIPPDRVEQPLSEREQTLAALGFALHHLTEPLGSAVSMLDMHRATAVLTKQITTALETDDAVDTIAHLLVDPGRVAMVDGRTAAQFCGAAWHHVEATSAERAAAALEGVEVYGSRVVARLACLRSLQALGPWWGTTSWELAAQQWFEEHRLAPRLLSALLRRPERVDDAIIADVLNRALEYSPDVTETRATG